MLLSLLWEHIRDNSFSLILTLSFKFHRKAWRSPTKENAKAKKTTAIFFRGENAEEEEGSKTTMTFKENEGLLSLRFILLFPSSNLSEEDDKKQKQ